MDTGSGNEANGGPDGSKSGQPMSGFAILVVILLVCVIVAWLLSTIATSTGPEPDEIVFPPPAGESAVPDQGSTD